MSERKIVQIIPFQNNGPFPRDYVIYLADDNTAWITELKLPIVDGTIDRLPSIPQEDTPDAR